MSLAMIAFLVGKGADEAFVESVYIMLVIIKAKPKVLPMNQGQVKSA